MPRPSGRLRSTQGLTGSHISVTIVSHLTNIIHDNMFRHFRSIFRGELIANVGTTAERASRLIAEGFADSVAFGRTYIANPDLVERLATGAPLAGVDCKTVYAPGPRGYTDSPAFPSAATE